MTATELNRPSPSLPPGWALVPTARTLGHGFTDEVRWGRLMAHHLPEFAHCPDPVLALAGWCATPVDAVRRHLRAYGRWVLLAVEPT